MRIKRIIGFIIVAVIGGLIWWKKDSIKQRLGFSSAANAVNKRIKGNNVSPAPSPSPIVQTAAINYVSCNAFPFKKGCKGESIKHIQKALNRLHNAGISEDGYFGPQTEMALINNGYGEEIRVSEYMKLGLSLV